MPPPSPSFAATPRGTVDRVATVARHGVRLGALDPRSPLQVGNGEFAFAVDPTGMQTFPDAYPVAGGGSLLGTMAQWGWHSLPAARPYSLGETLREYDTPRGPVPYVDLSNEAHDAASQTDAETWLRGNPHKLQLATIGLWAPSSPVDLAALTGVDQHLDLLTGIITSRFRLGGARYTTITAVHPERDAVAIDVTGPPGVRLGVRLRFPYGSDAWADASDWSRPEAHTTRVERVPQGWRIMRQLDGSVYSVIVHAHAHADGGEAGLEVELRAELSAEHELVFVGTGSIRVVIEFLPGGAEAQGALATRAALDSCHALDSRHALDTRHTLATSSVTAASARWWADFWSSGACVDLSGSSDPRAHELERRIVLSQYLTAINCSGSAPPAETGLLLNSWRGKFHLEMHLFHALHFAAWGRPRLLERSLGWYHRVLGVARETAASQGHAGARWPKQVGPDGRETPSSIGPFLVWQQPHLIYLLEMLYRADPDLGVLERHAELIFATAEFMASFPVADGDGFHLGPPIVPAQESYASSRSTARDPTFELAYWAWALTAACGMWERLGRTPPPRWSEVATGLARASVHEGRYAALATPPYLVRDDHPSMLAAFGVVPPTQVIDPEVMARTFDDVMADWHWASTWGWDYPVAAMTAARLGRRNAAAAVDSVAAVDALLLDRPKNTYLVNGHNHQTDQLPVYLPGNGALLMAVAMMAGGWDDSVPAPGFGPGWSVAHEGLVRLP